MAIYGHLIITKMIIILLNNLLTKNNPLEIKINNITEEPSPYIFVRKNLKALISRSVFYELIELATKKNIVLVFDECTSGFRETFGGIYQKYGVEPDMAMFGKTIGNGYALTAVVGKREVMEAAQKTFISSTFWTESIGPTAALKTLELMERQKSRMWLKNMLMKQVLILN